MVGFISVEIGSPDNIRDIGQFFAGWIFALEGDQPFS